MMISLYAHGMSVRGGLPITGHVLDEVRAWQPGSLDPVCEVAFPGAIVVKVPRSARSSGVVNASHLKR